MSHKRKKASPPVAPLEILYCPRSFNRYDNTQTGYGTCWVCKMCKGVVLSEAQVKPHMENCKKNFQKMKAAKAKKIKEKCDLPSYICEVCNQVFTRNVVLKKHAEEHKPKMDGLDEDEQDENNSTKRVPKRKYVRSSLNRRIKREPKNYLDNPEENTTVEPESKFSRNVVLKKYPEEHKPKIDGLDKQEKNNSTKSVPKRKYVRSSLNPRIKQEPKDYLDNTEQNTMIEPESKFSRNVVLKKYPEEHKPKIDGLDKQEKNISTKRVPKRKYVRSSLNRRIKQEPKNYLANTEENTTIEPESNYVPPLVLHKRIKTEPITEDDTN